MCVILGLASLMSYILVIFAKKRTGKVIDSVQSVHSVVDIRNERNKMKRIFEKQLRRKVILDSSEKVNTG